jgi:hypothetical protein
MADADALLDAIHLAKNHYFKKTMNKQGRFIYEYTPSQNKKSPRYNMLRHAGTVYAMLEVVELTKDPGVLTCARQGLKYLTGRIESVQIDGQESCALVDNNSIKLGGNGLSIIALAKYCEVARSKTYVSLMQELAKWIVQKQRDDGWFPVHKMIKSTMQATDFVSGYYPGEAILALVRLYRIDKDEKWLTAAQKAADYIIHVRDKNKIIHDHWFMYALNDLYRFCKKRDYIDHSLKMAREICSAQIRNHPARPEWNGGYLVNAPPPRTTPAACRSEGLGATYNLVRDFGDPADRQALDPIKQAICAGIDFQLQMQVKGEIKISKKWLGGFMESPVNAKIRIDYTQHNISSIILFYRILEHGAGWGTGVVMEPQRTQRYTEGKK